MSNTTRPEITGDGRVMINSYVNIPLPTSGDDLFFNEDGGKLPYGYENTNYSVTFPSQMDYNTGDLLEWYAQDDNAGFQDTPIAVLEVLTVSPNQRVFTFIIRTLSKDIIKAYRDFKVELQQEDPLFEFKFPRFAYRYKYEDGEYSTYSPFSEVAFIPDEFDYLPKKGYNLGMTNNLRKLILSDFKPPTMPLDVVAIDILYKESNSPNVYTVDTIKSPSTKVKSLNTINFSSNKANSWFGRIKYLSGSTGSAGAGTSTYAEAPNTLSSSSTPVLVSRSAFFAAAGGSNSDSFVIVNGVYYFKLMNFFGGIDVRIGDILTFIDANGVNNTTVYNNFAASTGQTGEIKVVGMQTTTDNPHVPGGKVLALALTHGGVAVGASAISGTWLFDNFVAGANMAYPTDYTGSYFKLERSIPKEPAVYYGDPKGSFEIKTDMIHATLPANQLLRPWDNVPRKALAQEITGNRIVYGNYTQNYDLTSEDGEETVTKFLSSIKRRMNIPDNIRYNKNTALKHPLTGEDIVWYDTLNSIIPELRLPERSLKSIRDYQLGVVYMDEYGRQTPVQTSESGSFRIKKTEANDYNALRVKLDDVTPPSWASHFKFYIKENSNEYYNLAMDRFYPADDGNIWLSFPSSERNKVDEDTYLILKKQHDSDTFVSERARYKIIAIENEAPVFVKTKYNSFGIVTIPSFPVTGEPRVTRQHIELKDDLFLNSSFSPALEQTNLVIRIHGPAATSRWYDVSGIADVGAYKRITVLRKFEIDMAFTTDDGTENGSMNSDLSVEIAWKEVKELPEFSGRFFVKILKDGTLEKHILTGFGEAEYVAKHIFDLGWLKGLGTDIDTWRDDEGEWNQGRFYVDQCRSAGVHSNTQSDYAPGLPYTGAESHGYGYLPYPNQAGPSFTGQAHPQTKATLDIGLHWMASDSNGPWGPGDFTTNQQKTVDQLQSAGNLFRFRGDTTIYKITYVKGRSIEAYDGEDNTGPANPAAWFDEYAYGSNHSYKWHIEFFPRIGEAGVTDAVGRPATGYNPFEQNAEGTALTGGSYGDFINESWPKNGRFAGNERKHRRRTIEFLEQAPSEQSYSSDNPAIWETEPKEDIDLDLYNEIGEAIPIKQEWNTYYNRFEVAPKETWWHAMKYYNCFSFANGVESNRIRDDFNAVTIDKGPKASTVLAEQYREEQRKSGLIYSGIYNSTSGINRLNQFIQAESITKDLNPTYGSIQKLWSKDTSLTTMCEDRIINVQANKDALYNADGSVNLVASNRVLGDARPLGGDYGISTDPESFAADQYRAYFTDKSRGVVLRMSQQGLTPISDAGMRDYFKDAFRAKEITLKGSYDENKNLYNLSIESKNNENLSNTDNDNNSLVSLNPGGIPTQANYLGLWFRYGGIVDAWATYMESGGTCTNYYEPTDTCLQNVGLTTSPQMSVGNTNGGTRGWAGIRGGELHPTNVEHGREGIIVNQGLNNPIKVWMNKMTTGYSWRPTIDATSNFDALIDALNIHGPNNVYLYQNFAYADTPIYNPLLNGNTQSGISSLSNWPYSWYGPTGVATPGSGFAQHQPEAVYSIQSVVYDAALEVYELELNWLVGLSGYQDVNVFKWSLTGPFQVTDDANDDAAGSLNADASGLVNITASFSEDSKGWTSFKSWLQECGLSLNDKYFTFNSGNLYQHHSNEIRNNFYGINYNSTLCMLFNDAPSSVKSFSSLSYEGTQSRVWLNNSDDQYYNNIAYDGWYASEITTDLESGFVPEFIKKEGKWFNYIKGNKSNNLTNLDVSQFSTQGIGRISAISSDVGTTPGKQFTLTVKDSGDID